MSPTPVPNGIVLSIPSSGIVVDGLSFSAGELAVEDPYSSDYFVRNGTAPGLAEPGRCSSIRLARGAYHGRRSRRRWTALHVRRFLSGYPWSARSRCSTRTASMGGALLGRDEPDRDGAHGGDADVVP